MSRAEMPSDGAPLQSGVPRLDQVLGGGLPHGDLMLVVGPPGAGKTTLACQVAFRAADRGLDVVFLSTHSEPTSRLIKHIKGFTFWDAAALGQRISVSSVYPAAQQGPDSLAHAITDVVERRQASLLVLDGLATLDARSSSTSGPYPLIHDLSLAMAAAGCTTVITSSNVPDMRSVPPEFAMCDSILELTQTDCGANTTRALRVWKLRGASSLLGSHAIRITHDGMTVYPCIEAQPVPPDVALGGSRVSVGTPELDAMMGGGLPPASSTVLAGGCGTGKTLMGLQYLLGGARRAERGLFVNLRDSARQLLARAETMSSDLAVALANQRISLLNLTPMPLEPDVMLAETWDAIERTGATRLVIDSMAEVEHALPLERKRSALGALLALLRARGVTSLLLRETRLKEGQTVSFTESPLSVVAENVIWLSDTGGAGSRRRTVCITKMRDSAYDPSLRYYELDQAGLRILPAAAHSAGLSHSSAAASEQQAPTRAEASLPDREME